MVAEMQAIKLGLQFLQLLLQQQLQLLPHQLVLQLQQE